MHKGGNATTGVMALMDARLLERHAIIINYHRYYISDSVLVMTSIISPLLFWNSFSIYNTEIILDNNCIVFYYYTG